MDVPTLTAEEIQTLQTDAALRLLGQIDHAIVQVNEAIFAASRKVTEAEKAVLDAKGEMADLKAKKQMLVERARILKTIVQNS